MLHNVAGEHFWDRMPKLLIIFREILSYAHGNFEHQNGVMEPLESFIIITYYIIYYNVILLL
jgi:hypothetical protein